MDHSSYSFDAALAITLPGTGFLFDAVRQFGRPLCRNGNADRCKAVLDVRSFRTLATPVRSARAPAPGCLATITANHALLSNPEAPPRRPSHVGSTTFAREVTASRRPKLACPDLFQH